MSTATAERPDLGKESAHLAHEARLFKSLAVDAVDDGVYAAKRAMKAARRRVEEIGDLRDEAVYRMKRNPLKAVGITLGLGLVVGIAAGWFSRRPARQWPPVTGERP